MDKKELASKITSKKEFSQLPMKDVEIAFSHFEKRQVSEAEKVRLTRELLHKVYGAFGSRKILGLKYKNPKWALSKHLSTRERLPYYREIYKRILRNFKGTIFDLGAGINGFSYGFFREKPRYIAIEAIGQFVDLMDLYFKKEKINGKAIHESLFNIEEIKRIIKAERGSKIIFLFKVIDALEMVQKDYSKRLLSEIAPLAGKIILSFPTESMAARKKFAVKRGWLIAFLQENFKVLDDFGIKGERFIVFSKR